jgi:hypothetical protein
MKAKISTEVNNETFLKLTNRARRVGMTPEEAFRFIALHGVDSFLRLLVGATKERR